MENKLTQGEKNKLRVLKYKKQKIEEELAEYIENYIEPMEEELKNINKEIDDILLEQF